LTRLAWGSLGLFAGWSCWEDVRGVDLGVCEVLFLAVAFFLRLGLGEEIKGDPCSVEAVSEPLAGVLSAEESMSSITMGSSLDDWTGLKVLWDARQDDFLVSWTEGCLGEDFNVRLKNFRTRGKLNLPAVVLTRFFLGSSPVRFSVEGVEETGSVSVRSSSVKSISPTFSNESPWWLAIS